MSDTVDVLIVGAGISGVGMACHLSRELPGTSYRILERRQKIGGTWDLFKYPGIRSDSDMVTFGFGFRPWTDTKVLADGASIQAYLAETAEEYGVVEHISFGQRMVSADWSSADQLWTVHTVDEASGESATWTAKFLVGATGYYNYDTGFRPEFPGEQSFAGTVIHPQHWPADLDYAGKNVVIIGSGATAVTLVPAMADEAASVTMLQRSPTYMLPVPANDPVAAVTGKLLPDSLAYRLTRGRNILQQRLLYALSRSQPALVKRLLLSTAKKQLGGSTDMANFTPRYNPWDQRMCVIPGGDLFRTIRDGKAQVVTGTIDSFTPAGVKLTDGTELPADIIVTATGLEVQMLGGAELFLDGSPIDITERLTYKAVLIEGVPNAAMIFGYTNSSWTLKVDLAAQYICRLLATLDGRQRAVAVAYGPDAEHGTGSILSSLSSGYVTRGNTRMPRQGKHAPWRVTHNYLSDYALLKRKPVDDGVLQFLPADAATAGSAAKAGSATSATPVETPVALAD